MLKIRRDEAAKPKHTVVMLDEADNGLTNRISSGMATSGPAFQTGKKVLPGHRGGERFARIPRNELLDQLFSLFEKYKYYQFSTLRQETQQPESYLREVLSTIAAIERRGSYTGYWALKPEYSAANVAKRNEEREAQRKKEEKQKQQEREEADKNEEADDDDDDDGGDDGDDE